MEITLKIATYFLVYSFLGWCLESIYKSLLLKKVVNSGFLFGPLCPIYGVGAIIMYIFLDDLRGKPVITFCLGFVVLSILEYFAGLLLEKIFHTKYWDYTENKFNFQGRVCLLNSTFWGMLAVIFIEIINPLVTSIIEQVNVEILMYVDIVLYSIAFIDLIVTIINTISFTEKLKYIEELNKNIREKIDEIKEKGMSTEIGQSLQDALDELKSRRDAIVQKSYENIIRLKRAFPTMKSEQITKFLNEKKENFRK